MPTVSLCMMIKNEEILLAQCLKSIENHVDEIIVVDTGSTDRSVEIAQSFGAKVHIHPWENSFSKHRNQSVNYASGDWIFVMDADEELKEGCGSLIRQAVSNDAPDSIMIPVINYFNNRMSQSMTNQVRLFRKSSEIYYSSPVHNQLKGYRSTITYPIYLYHYGYDLNPEKMNAKFLRTSTLLKNMIKKEPDRFRHHHDLAVCYAGNRMFREAIQESTQAIELAEKANLGDNTLSLWSHFITAFSYYKLGHDHVTDAENYALAAIEKCPDHLDSYFILVLLYHLKKDWHRIEEPAENYLRLHKKILECPETFGYMLNNTFNEEWRVRLALGDLYLEKNEPDKAKAVFDQALQKTPDRAECYKIIGDFYRSREVWKESEKLYEKALKETPEYPEALFGLALLNKAKGDSKAYAQLMHRLGETDTGEDDILVEIGVFHLSEGRYVSAVSIFEKLVLEDPENPDNYANLALSYKHTGFLEKAIQHNRKALDLKADHQAALVNLGHLYFESRQHDLAKSIYTKAIESDSRLIDVLLRLAHIALIDNDIEDCVRLCDLTLKALDLSRNITLHSIEDLAGLYVMIAHSLQQSGKAQLSREALEIAACLDPELVNTFNPFTEAACPSNSS